VCDALTQFRQWRIGASLVKLDRSMKGLEQREAANIAYKQMATGSRDAHRLSQNCKKVVDVREVLDHRVQDHQVDTVVRQEGELMCQAWSQHDVAQVLAGRDIVSKLRQHLLREVQPDVCLAISRESRQQQATPASDLDHLLRVETPKLRDGFL